MVFGLSGKSPTKVRSFLSPLGEEVGSSKRMKYRGNLTFSIYPDEGAILFPFIEFIVSSEPGACLFVVNVTCRLVVCSWDRRAKELLELPVLDT
jgi:hypothetical protein